MGSYGAQGVTLTGAAWAGASTTPYTVGAVFSGAFTGGILTDIHVYAGSWLGATNMQVCIWNSASQLLWASNTISVPKSTGTGLNQQAWIDVTGLSAYIPPSGGGLIIGLARDSAGSIIWTWGNGGTVWTGSGNASSPNFSPYNSGLMNAYFNFNPAGGVKVWNGSSWTKYKAKVGGTWYGVKVYNGSSWTRYG